MTGAPSSIQHQSRTTAWDFVVVRHGKGVVLHRASPTLNRVALENNAGAAMSLDLEVLADRPSRFTAAGNGLNGISIPPGTIASALGPGGSRATVAEGIVTVGLPPMTLSTTLDLRKVSRNSHGATRVKRRPQGGLTLDVVSSAPNVASVAGTLTLPAGGKNRFGRRACCWSNDCDI